MITSNQNKLHVKNIQEITFVLGYFYLLYEGLQEDLDGNCCEFCEDLTNVAKDKLSQCLLFMVLHEQKCQLFV